MLELEKLLKDNSNQALIRNPEKKYSLMSKIAVEILFT